MPFAEGQSLSPRVHREMLHPRSMDAADSHGVIISGQPGPAFFNYQVQICVTPRGTWIACWTQGGHEAHPDQRVVAARSEDGGRTWSAEVPIEPAAGGYRVPAWVVPFVVPQTGRVYAFYWYNVDGIPLRDAGDLFYRVSDDEGRTWSARQRVGIPRTAMDEGEPGDVHGWNFGQPHILATGRVMMTYTKIRRSSLYPKGWRLSAENEWLPEPGTDPDTRPRDQQGGSPNAWWTEVFLLEMPNILTEPDAARLQFRFLPEGGEGLWVAYPGDEGRGTGDESGPESAASPAGRHFGQEGTLAGLSGGRLLCVFRTRRGHPYHAVSDDGGGTWPRPEPLRLCPGGEVFDQPCAPCPITRLPDGRLVFLFHNVKPEGSGWYPRDPLWVSVGREAPGVRENAGLFFTKPRVLVYNDGKPGGPFKDFEIGYPSFYRIAGRHYVAYANKTHELRVSEVPDELLDDWGLPAA